MQIGSETRTRTVTDRVQTGTESVKVGTRDLGNGYFEDVYEDRPVYDEVSREETYEEPVYREDPVYRNRIRYQIEKWETARAAKAAAADRSPRWPDPQLRERTSAKRRAPSSYEVLFEDKDGQARVYRARSQTEWESFEEGRSYRAKVSGDRRGARDPGPFLTLSSRRVFREPPAPRRRPWEDFFSPAPIRIPGKRHSFARRATGPPRGPRLLDEAPAQNILVMFSIGNRFVPTLFPF